jgi:hypothetical protein
VSQRLSSKGPVTSSSPYSHGLFVAEHVPRAELCDIHGGTHTILVTHNDQVFSRLFAFLDVNYRPIMYHRFSAKMLH